MFFDHASFSIEVKYMDEYERRRRSHKDDPEDIAMIFDTLSTKVPEMIRGILGSLFSPEAATNMGKAVAEFRKALVEGGIPEEEAMEMTRQYLATLTRWTDMVKGARMSFNHKSDEE
jgi:Sec-independent protein translocase protein TatA